MLNPAKSPVLFSALFACIAGLIAALSPIWQVTFPVVVTISGQPYEVTELGTLWKVLKYRPDGLGPQTRIPGLLEEDIHNVSVALFFLALSAAIGRFYYWYFYEDLRQDEMNKLEMK